MRTIDTFVRSRRLSVQAVDVLFFLFFSFAVKTLGIRNIYKIIHYYKTYPVYFTRATIDPSTAWYILLCTPYLILS